jgi:hypothetical protein
MSKEELIKSVVDWELGRIETKLQGIIDDLQCSLDGYDEDEKERSNVYPVVKAMWNSFKTAKNIVVDQRLGHDRVVTRTKEG